MALLKDWKRQTVSAAGASLLVPFGLLLVAAVVALGGAGLGGLGALGQLTSGPAPPEPQVVAQVVTESGAETTSLLAPGSAGGARGSTASEAVRAADGTGQPAGGNRPSGESAPLVGTPGPTSPNQDSPGQGGGGGDQGGTPAAPVAPAPVQGGGTVDRLGGTVQQVTKQLPGPVGPAVDRLIDPVLKACQTLHCP